MAAKSVYERLGRSTLVGVDKTARRHVYVQGSQIAAIATNEYAIGYDSEAWRQFAEYNSIDDLDDIPEGTVFTVPRLSPTE